MNTPEASAGSQLERLRGLVVQATQRLLGDTIDVDEALWGRPSPLPGWNRAQVATHLARQADGLSRLATGAVTGGARVQMYPSPEQRESDIEAGAGATGLELQIDLDTSATRLEEAFAALDEAGAWEVAVELRGGAVVPARLLPLARLLEVVVHHVDLDIGFGIADVDAATAEWLLEWCSVRLQSRDDFPRLELRADSGFTTTVGSSGEPRPVSGSSAHLLGWLTRRSDARTVTGDGGLRLPAF